ncbi:MAG: ABC transporter ATP-binding protein [Gammaproteobacteria bacterium]|nr:ABC transporter ATP-binding protein [Gammaproteobacteria bacterium]
MLQLVDLTKRFVTDEMETTALNAINLEISDGEFVAVMGPSGCGKTTLLNVIGMLNSPDEGQYLFEGIDIAKYTETQLTLLRRQRLGFIFQTFNLIDELTVSENVELALLYQGADRKSRRDKVAAVLNRVDISGRSRHFPQQLSGGQQQRVAIARALVGGPKLILADEPTGNLDSQNGEEVMALIKELNAGGTTVLMVTHSDRDAAHANRIVRMLDGRISASEGGV